MRKWAAVILVAVLLCGCATLTPEQQATLKKLESDIKEASGQVERIYNMQADIRQQYKDGTITAEKAVVWLAELQTEAKQATDNLQALLTDYQELKAQGVPWYHTVWALIATALSIYSGKKGLGLLGALRLAVGAIEKGGDQGEIKARIARAGNSVINKEAAKIS